MNKLLIAVSLCTFGLAHAQSGTTAKPAAPAASGAAAKPAASGAAAKPATPPSGATAAPAEMAPPKPGPETEALKPFAHSVTTAGTIHAGAMGPNSPEMPTKGKATCKWVLGNLWVACDIEDTAGTGKTAMKWAGHLVFGWDFAAKGYRGTITDNMGMQVAFKGTLEGAKLTWETVGEMKVPNMPTKSRMTLDATDPKAIKFTEEGMMGGKWVPMSSSVHKVAGK